MSRGLGKLTTAETVENLFSYSTYQSFNINTLSPAHAHRKIPGKNGT